MFDYSALTEMSSVTTAGSTHTMYANPSSTTTFIRQIWLHASVAGLTSFSGSTVRVYLVPDTATAVAPAETPTNQFFERALVTSETYMIDCGVPGIVLADQNDTLQIIHTAQTTLTYMVMGGTET